MAAEGERPTGEQVAATLGRLIDTAQFLLGIAETVTGEVANAAKNTVAAVEHTRQAIDPEGGIRPLDRLSHLGNAASSVNLLVGQSRRLLSNGQSEPHASS